ncbi:mucin-2 isoform X2 [Phyllopteryx taeniolatus]|uniref:mucin-2 isoform X2 n=1 Tax=Phyllopteryx taeniolatus TaxID=161469 RepID=UPI002AD3F086|nr:mucin-2 isoform X2 [Phyllopteryx taeniolatus]
MPLRGERLCPGASEPLPTAWERSTCSTHSETPRTRVGTVTRWHKLGTTGTMLLHQLPLFNALLVAVAAMVAAIDPNSVTATAEGMSGDGEYTTRTGMLDPISSHTTSMQTTVTPFTTTVRDETSVKNTYTTITSSLMTSRILTSTSQPGNTVTKHPPDPTDHNPTTADTTSMTTVDPTRNDMTSMTTTGQTNNYLTPMTTNSQTNNNTLMTTGPNNNDRTSMTTMGTLMPTTGMNNKTTMIITTGLTNSDTTSMATTSLIKNDTTSITTIHLTNNNTTLLTTTNNNTFTTIAGPTVGETTSMTTTAPTNNTNSMTTTSLTNNDTTSMTTNNLTNNDTLLTTTNNNTFTTTAGPTVGDATSMTTTTPTNNKTTLMTPTGPTNNNTAVTTTIGITTNSTTISPTPTLTINGTTSLATAAWTDNTNTTKDTTTWTTTAPHSNNDTTTVFSTSPGETSAGITTTSPTPSTAKSGATTPGPTSSITQTTTNNATQTSPHPTMGPIIVCPAEQCPLESVCLNGTCQCLSGSFLVGNRCTRAQMFPGQLHLTSLTFNKEMLNRSSKAFQDTAADISAVLAGAFAGQPGYLRSDVVKLAPGSVIATVNSVFDNTAASQEAIDQVIKDAIGNSSQGLLVNATFSGTKLCDQVPLPCDAASTVCTSANGHVGCSCKGGYVSTVYSNISCKACPSGQEVVGNSCQKCAFGYAGFNCTDSSLLAVVVVSCVLGGVLLILILALLSFCCWWRCSGGQAEHSDASPYPAGELTKPWPVGITPIPRANTAGTLNAASAMEMMDKRHHGNGMSGSYDLNPDGMKTFKSKNPSGYSYLVQGHENPYFLPGDDKKN